MLKHYLHRLYALPFSLFVIGGIQIFLKLLDFVGRGESLMKLPQLINHPLFGPTLIVVGFVWLAWITRKPEVQPVIYGPSGTPYEKPKHPVLVVAGVGIVLSVIVALPAWFYLRSPVDAPKSEIAKPPPPPVNLLTRYFLGVLPISVEPNSTAYVLQLNPNITEGLWEVKMASQLP